MTLHGSDLPSTTPASAIEVFEPAQLTSPVVFASPHSGSYYPSAFVADSCLELATLRRSEDCYVDELFADAPRFGAPLLRALYPRAYLDVNREPYELDPEMFSDPLPRHANTASARVMAGLGTIARIVSTRREIYRRKLPFAEAEWRIEQVYRPYHQVLSGLVGRARRKFGFCILVDCHSMPSTGLPVETSARDGALDFVLGDRVGLSCSAHVTDAAERILADMNYQVVRNNPYAGGYTTQHYGDPANGIHVLQIEINRALYMNEVTLERRVRFAALKADLSTFIGKMTVFAAAENRSLQYTRLSAE